MLRIPVAARALAGLLIILLPGCVSTTPTQDTASVSDALRERTGHDLAPPPEVSESSGGAEAPEASETLLPDGVNLDDGLSKDEAVAIALWENPAFLATLADLGFAHADLTEAGLLSNPLLALYFPWGPKQLEATLKWPLEAFWLRPKRVSIAHLNVERVAASLIENGLSLASEVKIAYADYVLARKRSRFSTEVMSLQAELAQLADARYRAGDISELEADLVHATALEAEQAAGRAGHQEITARDGLAALLGMDPEGLELAPEVPVAAASPLPTGISASLGVSVPGADSRASGPLPDLDLLLADALAARPDVRAAELAIEAAGQRAGLARIEYIQISGLIDANQRGLEGAEAGPYMDIVIPLFNRNQGGVSRAEAELRRAAQQYAAVQNEISLGVRVAYEEYIGAYEALAIYHDQILPRLENTVRHTERAENLGDVSYLDLVRARLAILQVFQREAEVAADLQRAKARLEKAVGKRIADYSNVTGAEQ